MLHEQHACRTARCCCCCCCQNTRRVPATGSCARETSFTHRTCRCTKAVRRAQRVGNKHTRLPFFGSFIGAQSYSLITDTSIRCVPGSLKGESGLNYRKRRIFWKLSGRSSLRITDGIPSKVVVIFLFEDSISLPRRRIQFRIRSQTQSKLDTLFNHALLYVSADIISLPGWSCPLP